MANKKPKKKDSTRLERYIVFRDGTEKRIVDENGKYWICEDAQYRKLNGAIIDVVERKEQIEETIPETERDETKEEKTVSEFEEGFDNIPEVTELF